MHEVIVRVEQKRIIEEAADRIFRQPIIGPLISLGLLFLVFFFAFAINTGFPLDMVFETLGYKDLALVIEEFSFSGLLEKFFTWLSEVSASYLISAGSPEWLVSLIAGGIIPGVGSVLSFLPLIIFISLFIAVLEDSGLAPRMAIAFHHFFARFGLSGRAIFPMIISLGCNVPGVLASRAATEEEERVEIILGVPFVPCQARLVVLLAFVGAFFKSPIAQATVILGVYVLGILVYLVTALLARIILFKKRESPEFLIEIPPLHKPNGKVVWWITWDYSKHFLKKAGIIIFLLSVITWMLLSYGPSGLAEDPAESYGAVLGHSLSPILQWLYGLKPDSGWRIGFALIHGFIAKEALVESITLLQGVDSPREALLSLGLTPSQALAILVYMMLYVPCLATIAVMYQELKNVKLTILAIAYILVVATIISTIIYEFLNLV